MSQLSLLANVILKTIRKLIQTYETESEWWNENSFVTYDNIKAMKERISEARKKNA
jgi:hypothetical protein